MCSSNSEDIEHSSTSGFQKDWLRLLLKMNTILLFLLVINLHQIQSISTFWSCSDFSVKKKLLETKILNDDHSGRSMRLVGKQYCRHRQALWHPEQVSGEHQQASLSLCLTSQSLMQTLCQQNPSCSWFTHFDSQCYLLRECGNTEL